MGDVIELARKRTEREAEGPAGAPAMPSPGAAPGPGSEDALLVQRALAGHEAARERLFRSHVRRAHGLAHRLMPGDPEVDDVVQDAFCAAFEALGTLRTPEHFGSWLGGIVIRTARNRLRRHRLMTRLGLRRAAPVVLDDLLTEDASPEVRAELHAVYALLGQLDPDTRLALVLRRVEEHTLPEIAERMQLSLATVKRRLDEAESQLEALLTPARHR
jgi:RNA polymerase sigma-70 factor, ECF subfamily